MIDEYKTIAAPHVSEIKIKSSKFIAHGSPAESKEEAEYFIAKISKQFFDASHHCYAYQIGAQNPFLFRFNDDEEPSSSAGKPIYQAIQAAALTNLVVVVTRYFGGTKLGVGGLVRAYSAAAKNTLDSCRIVTKILRAPIEFSFPYDDTNTVMRWIQDNDGEIENSVYDVRTQIRVLIRLREVDSFKQVLIERTSGRVRMMNA